MLATVQLPAHACGNTFSGEPDAGKSACPVRRGESGSHRKVSPSLLLYRGGRFPVWFRLPVDREWLPRRYPVCAAGSFTTVSQNS
jgi:hypothetical protein